MVLHETKLHRDETTDLQPLSVQLSEAGRYFKMFTEERAITLENLPQAVKLILEKVEKIETSLETLKAHAPEEQDQWMDVEGLMAYHPDKPARKTIYDWVTLRRVPYHKDGKRLRFLRSEIDAWLAGGYHKTEDEMQEAAVEYVNSKRGGFRYDK